MQFYEAVGKVKEVEYYHWQAGRATSLLKYANQRGNREEPVELGQRREALLDLYYRMSAPEVQIRSRETQRPVKNRVVLRANPESLTSSVPTSDTQVSCSDSITSQTEELMLPKNSAWADWSDEEEDQPATGSNETRSGDSHRERTARGTRRRGGKRHKGPRFEGTSARSGSVTLSAAVGVVLPMAAMGMQIVPFVADPMRVVGYMSTLAGVAWYAAVGQSAVDSYQAFQPILGRVSTTTKDLVDLVGEKAESFVEVIYCASVLLVLILVSKIAFWLLGESQGRRKQGWKHRRLVMQQVLRTMVWGFFRRARRCQGKLLGISSDVMEGDFLEGVPNRLRSLQ